MASTTGQFAYYTKASSKAEVGAEIQPQASPEATTTRSKGAQKKHIFPVHLAR